MTYLCKYKNYLLYQVEEKEGIDINTSSGNRYIRNSILIFSPTEKVPKLGDECRVCRKIEEAKILIDELMFKVPILEQMKQAEKKSKELKFLHEEDWRRRKKLAEAELGESDFLERN